VRFKIKRIILHFAVIFIIERYFLIEFYIVKTIFFDRIYTTEKYHPVRKNSNYLSSINSYRSTTHKCQNIIILYFYACLGISNFVLYNLYIFLFCGNSWSGPKAGLTDHQLSCWINVRILNTPSYFNHIIKNISLL
jgi:hypothetical protein